MSDGRRNLPCLISSFVAPSCLSAFECLYARFRGRERPEEPSFRSAIGPFPNPPRQLSSPIGHVHRRFPQQVLARLWISRRSIGETVLLKRLEFNHCAAALAVLFVFSLNSCSNWCSLFSRRDQVEPLVRAHAHNDYRHDRPLLDALENGFTSVEADVHLVNGDLLVAHDEDEVKAGQTLEALYLEPLRARVKRNRGQVYRRGGEGFLLLIDLKTNGEATYEVLRESLYRYKDMLTLFEGSNVEERAVTVVLSGDRPREMLLNEKVRYAGYDGRLKDLAGNDPAAFMPLVSDNWSNHFTWKGLGEMPEKERQRLKAVVQSAHMQGKKIRFWGTFDFPCPARRKLWRELLAADVDLINTDDLEGLRRFLLEEEG